ncbi:MAG: hypothetical protein QGG36_02275 [Pirellulaceae bacterium]|jgi:hypothetical protein|nr:hypothetical protein [Pirellulaceae bacterium]
MGLLRTMFLGDFGNWLDTQDNTRRIAQLRRRVGRGNARVDDAQNARLDALECENEQLRVCLASISHLLIGKNVVTRDEIASIIDAIERPIGDGPDEGEQDNFSIRTD